MSRRLDRGPELAFLPAALEIEQRPPSPLGRAVVWTLILFFAAAIAWAVLGRADIVAVAPGRIVASGQNKVIQPLEKGAIAAIHVHEGQRVAQGDLLLELDDGLVKADLQRIQLEQVELERDSARLALLADWLAQDPQQSPEQAGLLQLSGDQRALLLAQWEAHTAALQALRSQRRKRRAEGASLAQQVRKLSSVLPLLNKRVQALQRLVEQKFMGEAEFLEMEQQRVETQYDLESYRKRREEVAASLAQMDAQLLQTRREFHSQVLREQQENRQRYQGLVQEQIKATERLAACTLRAPIGGVVQQLAVHTVGGIVTPAQQLMVIIPEDVELEVEAMVANKDIGFVHEGQPVEVKVDAFPFTRYGIIDAVLVDLSKDAIANDARGLVYKARVGLQTSQVHVDGKWIGLTPGMTVTAEVKTGERRLIEFFVSPLLRYGHESIRER